MKCNLELSNCRRCKNRDLCSKTIHEEAVEKEDYLRNMSQDNYDGESYSELNFD
jgi:hypothetical protein